MKELYSTITDEQLQSLAAGREPGAEEALVERYVRAVRICSRPYFLIGGDTEDLIQEGMIGLLSAIREYDPDKGASFKTFANICIHNRIQSAVRSASQKKHKPLNDCIPFDDVLSDESKSLGTRFSHPSPEEQVLARETQQEFSTYPRYLSKFENSVAERFLTGSSYQEIADSLSISRQGVHEAVKTASAQLLKYEAVLGIAERYMSIRREVSICKEALEQVRTDADGQAALLRAREALDRIDS